MTDRIDQTEADQGGEALQIHLLTDMASAIPNAEDVSGAPTPSTKVIRVPRGVSYLVAAPGCPPSLFARPSGSQSEAAVLEPIVDRGRAMRLLVKGPTSPAFWVNGCVAPPLAILCEKDQLLFGGYSMHVTLFNQPMVGRPAAQLVGKACPICRLPIVVDTRVYTCVCQIAFHMEDDGADGNGLQCAKAISECSVCRRSLVLNAGYSYWPEELAHE